MAPRGAERSARACRRQHRRQPRRRRARGFIVAATPASRPGWPPPIRWRSMPGLEILAKGGNAVDAAVAVQAVLGLVEPQSSGVGGGAFLLYYDARSGKVSAWTAARKPPRAQAAACSSMSGRPLPSSKRCAAGAPPGCRRDRHAVGGAARSRCAALEGSLRAGDTQRDRWLHAYRRGWRCTSARARPFRPPTRCACCSRARRRDLQDGDLFRNPEYAKTLQLIAQQGPRAL